MLFPPSISVVRRSAIIGPEHERVNRGYNITAMEASSSRKVPPPGERAARAPTEEQLVGRLLSAQQEIKKQALAGVPGVRLARKYSDVLDEIIRGMFLAACSAAGVSKDVPLAVVATGGYGRRELCPHSDVDITFVPGKDGDADIDRVVKEMFNLLMKVLMDAAKMEVGYAYRLMDDCGHLDHQTVSGLLDARLVAGSPRVLVKFEQTFWDSFNDVEFIFTKLEERRRRHLAAGSTFRVVEPDIKIGPGGLRDLQTAFWLIQAYRQQPGGEVRGDRGWKRLVQENWVDARRVAHLRRAKEFLFRVRNAVHALEDRETDHLTTARQEAVAPILGYDGTVANQPAVERFMRDLYGHLSVIQEAGAEIAQRIEYGRLLMGIGLDCVERRLTPSGVTLVTDDPLWMVWSCYLAQQYGLDFSYELRTIIRTVLSRSPSTSEPARLAEVFTEILRSPRPVYPILQLMADLGILGWILPALGETLDLIPYDAVHDYTVGQHALYALKYLDELRQPGVPEELRELQVLLSELAAPEQLYLATVLHDVGKAHPGGSHWESGAAAAEHACRLLRWSTDATENVVFLVRHHLLMAETSRLRDLTLPETIRDFIAIVSDRERLRMLYLLTYADTRAVSAGHWTQVKARFLHDLYRRAEEALAGGAEPEFHAAQVMRTRKRLLRELSVENVPAEEVAAHLEHMPAHYVLNTSMEEIALHIAFARRARQGVPSVSFHDDRLATYTELTVCTRDDPEPGLLAKIAGVLYAADLNVHAAQVYTRVEGDERIALDTLYVDFRGRRLASAKRAEVENDLVAVLTGTRALEDVLKKRRDLNQMPEKPKQMEILDDISEEFTVVQIAFPSPRGVLYYASRALARLRWDIHSARLSGFRGRSVATFYVTGAKGLSEAEAKAALDMAFAEA